MDRNADMDAAPPPLVVATREGGVDRNVLCALIVAPRKWSPPARVAWIETNSDLGLYANGQVATREGGVDRNHPYTPQVYATGQSPPARVAWIETQGQRRRQKYSRGSPPARVAWIETLN